METLRILCHDGSTNWDSDQSQLNHSFIIVPRIACMGSALVIFLPPPGSLPIDRVIACSPYKREARQRATMDIV